MFDILNAELSVVFEIIFDDSIVSRSVADSYDLLAIDPGFVTGLNDHVAATT